MLIILVTGECEQHFSCFCVITVPEMCDNYSSQVVITQLGSYHTVITTILYISFI